jgi:hypothetical protein
MNKSKGYKGHMNQLPNFIKYGIDNWPTPRAGNPGSRKPGTGGKILAEEAKIHAGPPAPEKSSTSGKNHGSWATPIMGDAHLASTPEAARKRLEEGKKTLSRQTTGKLNPNWVEQLMGLPVGWTQLPTAWIDSASSETALSPKPQK